MKMELKLIMKINKLLLILLLTSCEHLEKIELKGEISGTRYSDHQFVKGKHIISARYPISEGINVKGSVSQQYRTSPLIETEMPDYGETSLEILF